MFALKLNKLCSIHTLAEVKVDAEPRKHLNLAEALNERQFVLGNPVSVQPSGKRAGFINDGADTAAAKLSSAGQRCGTSADERHTVACVRHWGERQSCSALVKRIHREALQPRYLNRLFVVAMHHASALAENLYRTGA